MIADKRARLTVKGSYNLPLQGPGQNLKASGDAKSLVFPYNPTITYSRPANYGAYDLAHTNYQPRFFSNTSSPNIQLTALFTNNTVDEMNYTIGALHFLRVVSLMHYGENDEFRGTPPPVLLFSAYGKNNYQNFPVVVTSVDYTLDSDLDYVESVDGTNLPAQLFIAVSLAHQPDLIATRKQFTVDAIANGSLLGRGFL